MESLVLLKIKHNFYLVKLFVFKSFLFKAKIQH